MISKLITLLNSGEAERGIYTYESLIAEAIEKYVNEDDFYELPMKEILKIIRKSEFEDSELICKLVSRMNFKKREKSTLLLNAIKKDDITLEECIKILSEFKRCPLCQQTCKLFKERDNLVDVDYEYEINELKKKIKELQDKIYEKETPFPPVTEEPFDFESNIHLATRHGKLTSVQYLVEQLHVDPNTKDENGNTPAMVAALNTNLEIIKYLNEVCHADFDEKAEKSGYNPIILAAIFSNNIDIIKYLYETCHVDVEVKDRNGHSPLHYASARNHLEVVKYLCETCQANVETKDEDGSTPINYAARNGHLEIIKYLYESCHANVETKDNNGNTPLIWAAKFNYIEMVKYLISTCHVNIN